MHDLLVQIKNQKLNLYQAQGRHHPHPAARHHALYKLKSNIKFWYQAKDRQHLDHSETSKLQKKNIKYKFKKKMYQAKDRQHSDRTASWSLQIKNQKSKIEFWYQARDRQHPDRTARRHALPRFDSPVV
jgi:hypothetical protein